MNKRFEIGKAYQHHSGMQMFICGMADTIVHGTCFIAEKGWNKEMLDIRNQKESKDGKKIESESGALIPVSMSKDAMKNWFEIPKYDFVSNNTTNQ